MNNSINSDDDDGPVIPEYRDDAVDDGLPIDPARYGPYKLTLGGALKFLLLTISISVLIVFSMVLISNFEKWFGTPLVTQDSLDRQIEDVAFDHALHVQCSPDLDAAQVDLSTLEVTHRHFWDKPLSADLSERVIPLTPEVQCFISLWNAKHQIPSNPTKSAPGDLEILSSAIHKLEATLIPTMASVFNRDLIAVIPVDGLGSSGKTLPILKNDEYAGFVVFIEARDLRLKFSQWVKQTWSKGFDFENIHLEFEGSEQPYEVAQFLVMHGLGHGLSFAGKEKDFQEISWVKSGNDIVSKFDSDLKGATRPKLNSTNTKLQTQQEFLHYLRWLNKTNFPTFESSLDHEEDFPESMASYWHSVIMKRAQTFVVKAGSDKSESFSECWSTERCKAKRAFLDSLFQQL